MAENISMMNASKYSPALSENLATGRLKWQRMINTSATSIPGIHLQGTLWVHRVNMPLHFLMGCLGFAPHKST